MEWDNKKININKIFKDSKKTIEISKNDPISRKKWKKFGKCTGQPSGPEPEITRISTEKVFIDTSESTFKRLTEIEKSREDPFMERMRTGKFNENDPFDQMVKRILYIIDTEEAVYKKEIEDLERERQIFLSKNMENKIKEIDIRIKEEEKKNILYVPPGQTNNSSRCTIKINGITDEADDQEIREIVEKCGKVRRMNVLRDHNTDKIRGLAFVTYQDPENAKKAIRMLKEYRYRNAIWLVELARDKK